MIYAVVTAAAGALLAVALGVYPAVRLLAAIAPGVSTTRTPPTGPEPSGKDTAA